VKVDKLTLYSEQKKGTKSIARQQLLGKFSTPEQLEEKILARLPADIRSKEGNKLTL
jgi:hypothetical protein